MLHIPARVKRFLDTHTESHGRGDFAATSLDFSHPLPVWQDGNYLVLTTPADSAAWQAETRDIARSHGAERVAHTLLGTAERADGRLAVEIRFDYLAVDNFPAFARLLRYYFRSEPDSDVKIVMVEILASTLPRQPRRAAGSSLN